MSLEDEETPEEGPNLPYPTKQDLHIPGQFPVSGEEPLERVDLRRGKLLEGAQTDYTFPNEMGIPARVLVSPAGGNFAYACGEQVIAGLIGVPQVVDDGEGNSGAVPMGMPMAGRGRGFISPFQIRSPSRGVKISGTWNPLPAIAGWSEDGMQCYWNQRNGALRCWNAQVGSNLNLNPAPLGEAAAPVPGTRKFVVVRLHTRLKTEELGKGPTLDTTEVVLMDLDRPSSERVLIPAGASLWRIPAVSPDGKRLAVVSNRGQETVRPISWRIFVLSLEGGEAKPVTPPAAQIESVCWTADSKILIYDRREIVSPPDQRANSLLAENSDLFERDLAAGVETRLTEGGMFTSPSVTKDGTLYFLMDQGFPNTPVLALMHLPLKSIRDNLQGERVRAEQEGKTWADLAVRVVGEAEIPKGLPPTAESLEKIVAAFTKNYLATFKKDPPASAAGLETQRREVAKLDLAPAARAYLEWVLGAVEGEYLRRYQEGGRWVALKLAEPGGENPLQADNLFGVAFNPFRRLHRETKTDKDNFNKASRVAESLGEVLDQARGRTLILTNDPAAAREAVDRLVDPNLARGMSLLAQNKGDEADKVLLEVVKLHEKNWRLAFQVARALQDHGRTAGLDALADWVDRWPPEAQGTEARFYNLLGLALLARKPDRAAEAFKNGLRCDLHYKPAYLNLAETYQKLKDSRSAQMCLRRYLHVCPQGVYVEDARRRLAGLQ